MGSSDRNYSAPVVPSIVNDVGEIWPCHDCLPWHIELVQPEPDGPVTVIEWHAVGCPVIAADPPTSPEPTS